MGAGESTIAKISRVGNEVATLFDQQGLIAQIFRGLAAPDHCGEIDWYASEASTRRYMDCEVARGSQDQSLTILILICALVVTLGLLGCCAYSMCKATVENIKAEASNRIVNLQSMTQQAAIMEPGRHSTSVNLGDRF